MKRYLIPLEQQLAERKAFNLKRRAKKKK